jgi:hypothetical protein
MTSPTTGSAPEPSYAHLSEDELVAYADQLQSDGRIKDTPRLRAKQAIAPGSGPVEDA